MLACLSGLGMWHWRRGNPEPLPPLTPAQLEQARTDGRVLRAKMLVEFPSLATVAPGRLADEENGYLEIYLYPLGEGKELAKQPWGEMLSHTKDKFDAELAEAALAEHAEFVAWVERVAVLPGSSSLNMPAGFGGYAPTRLVMASVEVLLVKGRVAAKRGDEDEALRVVGLAKHFLEHVSKAGPVCLLDEPVLILCYQTIQNQVIQEVLPLIGRGADLGRWQACVPKRAFSTASFAELLRGEWHVAVEYLVLQSLREDEHFQDDPEDFARAFSADHHYFVTEVPGRPLTDIADAAKWTLPSSSSGLSKHGKLLAAGESWFPWAKGYLLKASVQAQHQAALELLQLERSGATLDVSSSALVTVDPLRGLPFEFDPLSRTLKHPDVSAMEPYSYDPIELPW